MSLKELATCLFNSLLLRITKKLYQFVNHQLKPNIIERITGTGQKQKQVEIASQLDQLSWLAMYGSPLYVRGKVLDKTKQLHKQSRRSKRKIGLQSDLVTFGIGLTLDDEIVSSANMENEVMQISSGVNVLRASEIIKCLESTIKALDANYLYLFLDEWSDVLEIDVQPYFADLIKHVFLSNPYYMGKGSGTSITVFDDSTNQIKGTWVSSGGSTTNYIVYKGGNNKWIEKSTGSNPDGSKIETVATLTFSNNGKDCIITGGGTVDDEKMNDQYDVWRKVSK